MKPYLLCILFILSGSLLFSQSFLFAKRFHGNDTQVNSDVTTDAIGNIFTACNFYGSVDADPGLGVTTFTSVSSLDIAIVKLNSDGGFIWALQLGGSGFSNSSVLETDTEGNVFVFGYFNGTLDMDPTASVFNLVSAGSDEIYCGKYDADGNLLWAAKFGGTGTEQNYGFALDNDDNIVIHGYFQNTVDFNPGAGTFNLTAGVMGNDFILKLDNDGNFLWALKMDSFWGNETMVDAENNIVIAGEFFETVDFDPSPSTHNLTAYGFGADAVVLKLDSDGNYIWAVAFSGNMNEQVLSIAESTLDNTYITGGFFEGTMDADPGAEISNIISAGYVDGFTIKINNSDGSLVWGKGIGGLGFQSVNDLQVDETGGIHFTGAFEQTADFDPSGSVFNLTSAGYTDFYRLVWTSAGEFIAAEKIGGTLSDWSYKIHLDNSGAELITGYFDATVDFDPGPSTFNLSSEFTGWDGFLAKYCTSYTIHNYINICEGESFFAGGEYQTATGDYYDYYTPLEGCDSTVITHLNVNVPIVDLGLDTMICEGNNILLNAGNSEATFTWSTGAETQTITVSETGIYSVTITDVAGCIASDEIEINMVSGPVVFLGEDISMCSGESVELDAGNSEAEFLWNTGAITQTITVTTSGNYGVSVTNDAGCEAIDIVTVTVHTNPIVDLGLDTGICLGNTLLLNAENPGAEYLWNTGSANQIIEIDAAGLYYVTVTNTFNCFSSDSIFVEIFPAITVDLNDDIETCDGDVITLDSGFPDVEYLWNTGAITQTIDITESGTYYVFVTNNFGCSDADTVVVILNEIPFVEFPDTIEYCENEIALLDAENIGSTYLWSTGETTQQIIAASSGIYDVEISNDFGCTYNAETFVNLFPIPEISLGSDIESCYGEIILLDGAIPSGTYLWNTGATTSTIYVTTNGMYSVEVTNAFGCSNSDSIEVIFNATPFIAFDDSIGFCENEFALLDAENFGSTYLWNTGETTQQIIAPSSGIYSVEITNIFGCYFFEETEVIIYEIPEIFINADTALCAGTPVILDATITSGTYLWNTGATTSNIYVVNGGTYSVTVTNTFGCTYSDTILVIYFSPPVTTFNLSTDIICIEDAAITLDTGSPSGGIYSGPGVIGNLFTPSIAGVGTHTISYTYTDTNACTGSSSDLITVTICQNIEGENTNSNISIFPNPVNEFLTIYNRSAEALEFIEMYDLSGRITFSKNISVLPDNYFQIPMQNYVAGNYMVKILSDSQVYLEQIIITK
ncbi:MAG: T9SS type A sorting domain-containing protein [Chitinophagales bacterium]|nr:T9SS type A sorting domain-containing protein [Chitinophagales bacterium]MBP8754157.1 T9SS type A sorting domain-containing protein [Chitinophagales bacterium]MBP9704942.1 T9SS type A sorting domain-containing protein [Chitinophagales bacterium]